MKNKCLSPEMVDAYDYAKVNGDVLVRYAGGFWTKSGATRADRTFGTKTVHALVSRNAAEYVEWKDGCNGTFPISIRIKAIPDPTPL